MSDRIWSVYLSGEIHTDWRKALEAGAAERDLPIIFSGPVTIHEDSDDCGAAILGEPTEPFWRDKMGAQVNAIRTKTLIEDADIVVVRFGDKYKQWNAAFDAGYAAAIGTPIITLHSADIIHPLKEINGAALASCRTVDDVIKVLAYVTTGTLERD